VLTGNDNEEIQMLKKCLASENEIKDLDHLKSFLGMKLQDQEMVSSFPNENMILIFLRKQGCSIVRPLTIQ
jgi:hypothetical protein